MRDANLFKSDGRFSRLLCDPCRGSIRSRTLFVSTDAAPNHWFILQAQDASAILNKLVERDIITSTRRDGVRFSFHVYNDMDDVNAALTVLEDNLEFMVRS